MNIFKKHSVLTNIINNFECYFNIISYHIYSSISNTKGNKVIKQGGSLMPPEFFSNISLDFLKLLRPDLLADKTKDRLNLLFIYSSEIPDSELNDYTIFISTTIDKTQVPNDVPNRSFLQTESILSNRNKINL